MISISVNMYKWDVEAIFSSPIE